MMPALTVNAAKAPPSISHAPREAASRCVRFISEWYRLALSAQWVLRDTPPFAVLSGAQWLWRPLILIRQSVPTTSRNSGLPPRHQRPSSRPADLRHLPHLPAREPRTVAPRS